MALVALGLSGLFVAQVVEIFVSLEKEEVPPVCRKVRPVEFNDYKMKLLQSLHDDK